MLYYGIISVYLVIRVRYDVITVLYNGLMVLVYVSIILGYHFIV